MIRNLVFPALVLLFGLQGFSSRPPAVMAQAATLTDPAPSPSVSPKTRDFNFTYAAVLTNIDPGKSVNVWLPVATSNHDQDVQFLNINQENFQRTTEKKYGNALIYFEATANEAGEVPIEINYLVTRRELTSESLEPAGDSAKSFLGSTAMVPTNDELRKIVMASAGVSKAPATDSVVQIARQLYDGVDNHMKYNKPSDIKGWGKGDAVWACDSKFGNCTDFHSLFIASARNLKIASKFEIGFPIPVESDSGVVGGYHCWAKVLADGKWLPVDISEADKHPELKEYYFGNLTADRVMFSVGRDLELVPANVSGPVNFLVYPYAEVDGKQHREFTKAFRFSAASAPQKNSASPEGE
jgi:hypothetical protein